MIDLFDARDRTATCNYVERNPDDLQSRWMAAHYANLMQRRATARDLIDENLAAILPARANARAAGVDESAGRPLQPRSAGPATRSGTSSPTATSSAATARFRGVERWDGETTDQPLLIWSEQGFGDNIMFARFFEHVLERAPNAFLECRPELYELFEYSGIATGRLYRLGRTLPPYSCSFPFPPPRGRSAPMRT